MAWGLWLIERNGRPVGKWLQSHDPDFRPTYPSGDITVTSDPALAKRFPTVIAALEEWRRPSVLVPTRPDGQPNRPLSAFTASPNWLPD